MPPNYVKQAKGIWLVEQRMVGGIKMKQRVANTSRFSSPTPAKPNKIMLYPTCETQPLPIQTRKAIEDTTSITCNA